MKRLTFALIVLGLSLAAFPSCEKIPDNTTKSYKLSYSLGTEGSMYKSTRSSASDVFDEFYAKLVTGELVADSYDLTFTDVSTGTTYSFSGSWKGATVSLQAGTYTVTGNSKAIGDKSQEKCSICFDETITVTNQMTEIFLNAKYDCFLFVMTSDKLDHVDNCFLFENKYWYAFVNDTFVNTLTGTHKDGSQFSVDMSGYSFEKGKYYVYDDVSLNGYSIYYLLPKMDDGLAEPSIPSNQIWYTTDNGKVFTPKSSCKFYNSKDEPLTYQQSWDGEKWIIEFSDDIAYWKGGWFYVTGADSRLATFGVPATLDPIKMEENAEKFYQESFSSGYVSSIERFYGRYPGIADNGHLFLVGKDLSILFGAASAHTGSLTVPEGTKLIAGYAFVGCKAKEIILPSTIEEIQEYAFENCNDLSAIYCYAKVCPYIKNSNIWMYVKNTQGTLHYPAGSDYSGFPLLSGWTKVADIE